MRGYHVPRRAGWDCHGLPVELAVEKELGFTGKRDIERYGIAEFNAACRESALRNVRRFAADDRAHGLLGGPRRGLPGRWPRSYVESVWWSLKTIYDKGLLVEDHRVAPYCPRCGTPLSDHEVAQGYEDDVDPSVYVRFPLTEPAPMRPGGRPAGLDDDAVDAAVEHRGRGRARRHVRPRARGRRAGPGPRRAAGGARPRRRRRGASRASDRRRARSARTTRGRSSSRGRRFGRRAPRSSTATTSPPTTAPGWCTWRPRSAPRTTRSARADGLPVVNPIGAERPLPPTTSRWSAGMFFKAADPTLVERPPGARRALPRTSTTSTPIRTAGAATRR